MLSIVIPAYNEENRLGSSLKRLQDFLDNYSPEVEVIVVDDGSTDNTRAVAENFKGRIKNLKIVGFEMNQGKGFAVKAGFETATGEIVVFTDADFSTPINEIEKLVGKINEGNDIAIGSRAVNRELVTRHQSFLRESLGRLANILIQMLAVPGVKDTQCGFKAFRKETAEKLFSEQKIHRFAFDIELLYLAQKNHLKIAEVAVSWENSPDSKVSTLGDSLQSLVDLVRVRLLHANKNAGLVEGLLYLAYHKRTFVKFAVVGLSGTIVDYSTYFLLTRSFKLSPLQANPLSVELAIIWNFTLNHLWTFSGRGSHRALYKKFLAFQTVSFGGLMLSQMQVLVYTHYLLIFDLVSKLLTLPVVAVFNYFVNNRWTFHNKTLSRRVSSLYLILILLLFVVYLVLVKEVNGSFSLFVKR